MLLGTAFSSGLCTNAFGKLCETFEHKMNTVLTIPSSPTCQEDHFFTAHLEDKHFLATCEGDHHIVR